MNFMQAPVIALLPPGVDPEHFTLVRPMVDDPSGWKDRTYYNLHDGQAFRLRRRNEREAPDRVIARTYRGELPL